MNQQEYFDAHSTCLEEMHRITRAKNADYAGSENPFLNFELCEKLGVCSVEQGLLVRISDKLQRVANLLKRENEVKDETITDTLEDLANYAVILKVYLDSKKIA